MNPGKEKNSKPYWEQPFTPEEEGCDIRRIELDGAPFFYTEIPVRRPAGSVSEEKNEEKSADIVFFADTHLSFFDEDDLRDPELAYTHVCRSWCRDGATAENARRAMKFASAADQTVVCGDVIDYLTAGSLRLAEECIVSADPLVLLAAGGHEYVKQMQTGRPESEPFDVRRGRLEAAWHNDMYYVSREVGGCAMVILLNNALHRWYGVSAERLKADLNEARKKGLAVLIFEHEPISTGRPEDEAAPCCRVFDGDHYDIYRTAVGGPADTDPADREIYELITHSGDVIRGIFCGHLHSAYRTSVKAFAPSGKRADIPQYVIEGCAYDCGRAAVIRVTT